MAISKSVDMTQGPLLRKIILYTVPIMFSNLIQLLFNAADLIVVGRFGGIRCLAAVSSSGPITHLAINFFISFSLGAGAVVAQSIGAKDEKETFHGVHTAVSLALIAGTAVSVICVLLTGNIVAWMRVPEDVAAYSAAYLRIYFGGMCFNLLYNVGATILRAVGDTRSPLIFLSVAGVLNIGLNLFFVLVLHMTVDGVAWATVISQAVSAVLVILTLCRRKDACRLNLRKLHIKKKTLLKITRIGLPAGIQSSLFSATNVVIQSSINSMGSLVMSGYAAASNIDGFLYVAMNAFSHPALNFAGQNYGAGKFDRIPKAMICCIACASVTGLVVGWSFALLSRQLVGIYIVDSPDAHAIGVRALTILCTTYFLCGAMDSASGTLRGIGSSLVPMLVTVIGVCALRITWVFTVFAARRTLESLLYSYPLSWFLTGGGEIVAYLIISKKRFKLRRAEIEEEVIA